MKNRPSNADPIAAERPLHDIQFKVKDFKKIIANDVIGFYSAVGLQRKAGSSAAMKTARFSTKK